MKKTWALFSVSIGLCFAVFGAGCQQNTAYQEEAASAWAPPVQGLRWGMSVEEAVEAIGCESYESSENGDLLSIMLPDSVSTSYGVDLSKVTLGFATTDSGIPGNDGLVTVNAICAPEEIETLKTALDATYADYRKTDDFTEPSRWESEAMYELENASELEQALREALTQALGSEMDLEPLVTPSMGAPGVSYSLFTQGQTAGLFMTDGSNHVLRLALES